MTLKKAPWLVLPVPSHANGFIPRALPAHAAAPPELRARKAPKRRARRPAR